MKTNKSFSKNQDRQISQILINLRLADRATQKQLRERLRKEFGFYISAFTSSKKGFSIEDYRSLKEKGIIKIC